MFTHAALEMIFFLCCLEEPESQHTNIQFVRKNTYIAMILINIGQHFSFTTYMDRNLRPVIINIMKSEVSLVVYCIFFEFGCLYHYMYSSESEVLTVIYFKK